MLSKKIVFSVFSLDWSGDSLKDLIKWAEQLIWRTICIYVSNQKLETLIRQSPFHTLHRVRLMLLWLQLMTPVDIRTQIKMHNINWTDNTTQCNGDKALLWVWSERSSDSRAPLMITCYKISVGCSKVCSNKQLMWELIFSWKTVFSLSRNFNIILTSSSLSQLQSSFVYATKNKLSAALVSLALFSSCVFSRSGLSVEQCNMG